MAKTPKTYESRRGIFCIETATWDQENEKSHLSVRPMLEILRNLTDIPFIHRDVATKGELKYFLERWASLKDDRGNATYPILYAGFHGTEGQIYLNSETMIDIDDIRMYLDSKCENRVIHFGSCSTLAISPEELHDFLDTTEASAVSGFEKDIDWLESFSFECMYLRSLNFNRRRHLSPDHVRKIHEGQILKAKAHSQLSDHLGFNIRIAKG